LSREEKWQTCGALKHMRDKAVSKTLTPGLWVRDRVSFEIEGSIEESLNSCCCCSWLIGELWVRVWSSNASLEKSSIISGDVGEVVLMIIIFFFSIMFKGLIVFFINGWLSRPNRKAETGLNYWAWPPRKSTATDFSRYSAPHLGKTRLVLELKK